MNVIWKYFAFNIQLLLEITIDLTCLKKMNKRSKKMLLVHGQFRIM